jgi:radical SAM superfamily enzyme YgiQ (UPF0313 family)
MPPPSQPRPLLLRAHAIARALHTAAAEGAPLRIERGQVENPRTWLLERLEAPAAWDAQRLERDGRRLREIYQPIPILPPDQYGSIVLQATEGCSYDRCGFCSFYRGIPYRVRTVAEFRSHVEAVLEHLGRSAELRHRIFLGQANALLVEAPELEEMLTIVNEHWARLPRNLPVASRSQWRESQPRWIDGIYSFIDAFHELPSTGTLERFAALGVRRVYVGLESGSVEVLRILRKPGGPSAVAELSARLHTAGIGLGVILLVGAGGHELEEEHVRASVRAVSNLGLAAGDQVYLSRLILQEGTAYAEQAARAELDVLSHEEQDRQLARLRRALKQVVGRGVPIAPYDISLSSALLPSTAMRPD